MLHDDLCITNLYSISVYYYQGIKVFQSQLAYRAEQRQIKSVGFKASGLLVYRLINHAMLCSPTMKLHRTSDMTWLVIIFKVS